MSNRAVDVIHCYSKEIMCKISLKASCCILNELLPKPYLQIVVLCCSFFLGLIGTTFFLSDLLRERREGKERGGGRHRGGEERETDTHGLKDIFYSLPINLSVIYWKYFLPSALSLFRAGVLLL